ncbi:MAG: DUF429 domain-containing protein [Nitrospinae bacterium]|nr:DUF429 domain-containing protein [Nitrospinota bacterium]
MNPKPDMVTVDIPIGMPEQGTRFCDSEARQLLGPRKFSVFPTPIRETLKAQNYFHANQVSREINKKGMSKQTWNILPKIKVVDEFIRFDISRQQWVREVHPELCFYAWNNNCPMKFYKKSPEGEKPGRCWFLRITAMPIRKLRWHCRTIKVRMKPMICLMPLPHYGVPNGFWLASTG